MSRARAGSMSSAAFIRSLGLSVGAILDGSPIVIDGVQIEGPRRVRITAMGETVVLGRTQLDGESQWWSESSLSFDCRDWMVSAS